MKHLLLYSILYITPLLSEAQITQKIRKVVPLLTQQVFHLNADPKTAGSTPSRTKYQVNLPPHTIEWYYALTVSSGKSTEPAALNLVSQLEERLKLPGQSNILVATIISPLGERPCAVYLMDDDDADAFIKKVDQRGESFSFIPSGTNENIRNGVAQIKDAIYGSYWLGFKDPGGAPGITIRLEVAAITEENITNNSEWSTEIKDNLYGFFYENVKGKLMGDLEAKDIAGCMITQLTSSKTPGDYYAMNQAEKDSFLAITYRSCAAKYDEPKGPNYDKASNYANLAWIQYERGNIDSAITLNIMSISLDSTLAMVKANLGLMFLIKGDEAYAKVLYKEALEGIRRLKLSSRRKEYLEVVGKNLDEELKQYPEMKGIEQIKKIFEGQYFEIIFETIGPIQTGKI